MYIYINIEISYISNEISVRWDQRWNFATGPPPEGVQLLLAMSFPKTGRASWGYPILGKPYIGKQPKTSQDMCHLICNFPRFESGEMH